MSERGRYIVLEGAEGVGKTEQAKRLAGRLAVKGITAYTNIHEPGGTPIGEAVRTILKDQGIPRLPATNLALFNAARYELLHRVVGPTLNSGGWVVCDRNRLSSHVYQGHGEGMPLDLVRDACARAVGNIKPDLELILVVDEAERRRRMAARGSTDYFELLGDEFHTRITNGYLLESRELGIPTVDGNGTPEEVAERIWLHVEQISESND